MTIRIGIVAALIAASTAARADRPGAPGPAPQSDQDPLAHVEQDKLHLSKQQISDKFHQLDQMLTPPGSGRSAPPDDHDVNDILQRFTAWPPFRSLKIKAAWGGAESDFVSRYLDTGMSPAMLLLAARVWFCLPRDEAGKLVIDVAAPQTVAVFAACHEDMAKLDAPQLDKDLAADKRFDEFFRAVAHDRFALVKRDADALTAAMKAKAASDPEFKRLVFDVPDKAAQDWEAAYAAHAKDIDDARAFVHKLLADVPGRGAIHDVGCGEASHTPLIAYVQSQSPKTAADVLHVETDSVGYPLLLAAMLCDAYEGRLAAARGEHWILTRQFQRLGQRGAIAFAIIEEIGALTKAGKPAPFKVEHMFASPDVFTWAPEFWNGKMAKSSQDTSLQIDDTTGGAKDKKFDRGVVAAGAKTKDGLDVTFVKETWQVPDYDCVKSRIINWERDGTPIWD